MKTTTKVVHTFSLGAVLLLAFAGTSLAAAAVTPADGSLLDQAKPIWDAVVHGQYWLGASLALVLLIAALKKYAPGKVADFMHTDTGGALSVLLLSFGGALATGLMAVGTNVMTLTMVWAAVKVAIGAAGGYSLLEKLLVEPILKPLQAKAPPWLASLIGLILWVFDRPDVIGEAEAAGAAAVAVNPGTGVAGVVGSVKNVP